MIESTARVCVHTKHLQMNSPMVATLPQLSVDKTKKIYQSTSTDSVIFQSIPYISYEWTELPSENAIANDPILSWVCNVSSSE